jgi:hypothetical protein
LAARNLVPLQPSTSSSRSKSISISSSNDSQTSLTTREKSARNKLNEMLAEAEAGNFPKKNFENCGKMFGYTPYLHFTT